MNKPKCCGRFDCRYRNNLTWQCLKSSKCISQIHNLNKSKLNMELLTANQARKIVESMIDKQLLDILSSIKFEAEKGCSKLYLYYPLQSPVRNKLEELGYNVSIYSSTVKDDPYVSINW